MCYSCYIDYSLADGGISKKRCGGWKEAGHRRLGSFVLAGSVSGTEPDGEHKIDVVGAAPDPEGGGGAATKRLDRAGSLVSIDYPHLGLASVRPTLVSN